MKERAEQALKSEVAAVVTVPAHFEEIHLQETRQAASEAGLELIELIREPCAAALAYYHSKSLEGDDRASSQILVYDLGGGTLDVSCCLRQGSHVEVGGNGRAYDGDKFFGGLEFDKALLQLAVEQLAKQGIRLDVKSLGKGLPRASWLWELLLSAERTKIRLSDEPEVQWSTDVMVNDQEVSLDFWVRRSQFEECIQHLVEPTLQFCDNALFLQADSRAASVKLRDEELLKQAARELDAIILVGGSTKVPYIARRLQDHYKQFSGIDVKVRSFRVDECVAIGAAIYAAACSTRSSVGGTQEVIQWIGGPSERVGQDITMHDQLHGTVLACTGSGWSIELAVGSVSWRADVAPDGSFVLPEFSLQPGENRLEFTVRNASGTVCGRQLHTILRGGFTADLGGLARPIQVRLVDGTRSLLHQGSRPGSQQTETFYIHDTSPVVRTPLYEGHHPIGLVEFPVVAQPGTPVIFRTGYHPGKLDIQVQVGSLPPQTHEIRLQPLDVSSEQVVLWEQYQELARSINEILSELPDEGYLLTRLRKQYEALLFEIRTDFESLALDLARIDDRLRQLEHLGFRLRTFPNSMEGLKLRIGGLRQRILSLENNQDAELLNQLDEIEQKLPSDGNPEITSTLSRNFWRVVRRFRANHPLPVTAEDVMEIKQRIQRRIETIRAHCEDNAAALHSITKIDEAVQRIYSTAREDEVICSRLLELEFVHLTPLYHEVVVKRSQAGLLRSNA
jgi:hypothetical protein